MDLKDVCYNWNRNNLTTWVVMKQHFTTESQMNRTDSSVMQQQKQVNTVINLAKEQEKKRINKKHQNGNTTNTKDPNTRRKSGKMTNK